MRGGLFGSSTVSLLKSLIKKGNLEDLNLLDSYFNLLFKSSYVDGNVNSYGKSLVDKYTYVTDKRNQMIRGSSMYLRIYETKINVFKHLVILVYHGEYLDNKDNFDKIKEVIRDIDMKYEELQQKIQKVYEYKDPLKNKVNYVDPRQFVRHH
jgi:hypothetical protein